MQDLVLFTSNCFGEDRSAALIARELKSLLIQEGKSFRVMGASLISEGRDYILRGIDLLSSSFVPPSGGFPLRSLRGFLADTLSGSFKHIPHFVKNLRHHADKTKVVIVVGDVSLLFLTRFALPLTPTIFLSLPKSDYIQPHYRIEEWYITKNTSSFLTRDAYTARNLQQKGIHALFLGNPIVDELEPTNILKLSPQQPVLALLPGSREEAYKNFVKMLPIVETIGKKRPCHVVAALPSTLTDANIAKDTQKLRWEYIASTPFPLLAKENITIFLTRGIFAEVLHKATVVLGLAGTANEQAAALGKPIIAFRGTGPQTTEARFKEQGKLLGKALTYCRHYPEEVVHEILFLLDHPEERALRGAVGQERMGNAGGSKAIARYILEHYLQ